MGAKASQIKIFGTCPTEEYPLQKKRHSFEFLRTIAHLRPRTNTQGAVMRVRNALAFATHLFFQERGFPLHPHSDHYSIGCEGAENNFQSQLSISIKPPRHSDGSVDFSKIFSENPLI